MSSPETAPAVRMRNPDVIGTVMKEMNKHGLSMDLKKKNKYGGYDAADSSDMNVVKSQAKLANTGTVSPVEVLDIVRCSCPHPVAVQPRPYSYWTLRTGLLGQSE